MYFIKPSASIMLELKLKLFSLLCMCSEKGLMTLLSIILIWAEISWPPSSWRVRTAASGRMFYSIDTVSMGFLPICRKIYAWGCLTKCSDENPTTWFFTTFSSKAESCNVSFVNTIITWCLVTLVSLNNTYIKTHCMILLPVINLSIMK